MTVPVVATAAVVAYWTSGTCQIAVPAAPGGVVGRQGDRDLNEAEVGEISAARPLLGLSQFS